MNVLGRHGEEVFLVGLNDKEAVIVDVQLKSVSPRMDLSGATSRWTWMLAVPDAATMQSITTILTERGIELAAKKEEVPAVPVAAPIEQVPPGPRPPIDKEVMPGEKTCSECGARLNADGTCPNGHPQGQAAAAAAAAPPPAPLSASDPPPPEVVSAAAPVAEPQPVAADPPEPVAAAVEPEPEPEPEPEIASDEEDLPSMTLSEHVVARRAGTPGTYLVAVTAEDGVEVDLSARTVSAPMNLSDLHKAHPWTACRPSDAVVDDIARVVLSRYAAAIDE